MSELWPYALLMVTSFTTVAAAIYRNGFRVSDRLVDTLLEQNSDLIRDRAKLRRTVEGLTSELDNYMEDELSRREGLMCLPRVDINSYVSPCSDMLVLRVRPVVPTLDFAVRDIGLLKMPFKDPEFQRDFCHMLCKRWADDYVRHMAPQLFDFIQSEDVKIG